MSLETNAIMDKLISRVSKVKWTFGGGIGGCYMATLKARGRPVAITVWRIFDHWDTGERVYKYRAMFYDANEVRAQNVSGPLIFETDYHAGDLFNLIDANRNAELKKAFKPTLNKKELTLTEHLKRILSAI